MKLDAVVVKKLSRSKGLSLQELLRQAGVSRTAYYSLVRRKSVLPRTVRRLARELEVAPSTILSEVKPVELRARELVAEAQDILRRHPGASFENIWHTLVLLEEPPIERLRRSLQRGRGIDTH